jgi:hypothetical protein
MLLDDVIILLKPAENWLLDSHKYIDQNSPLACACTQTQTLQFSKLALR